MNYEIVELEGKTLVGLKMRVKDDKTMYEKIGNLWKDFYSQDNVQDKINDNAVAVYYNYNNKNGFEYDFFIGNEVESGNDKIPENMTKLEISKGKYAKFKIFGNPKREVPKFWQEFWKEFGKETSEIRAYTYDFEEYVTGNDYENTEINIYISIK
ncbi:GyrI-like domain-containing protein [Pseudoleptotrichia goodfellowii]|jgi:Uncharacterized protein conserved in bacteria|uniref:Transcriptional regulator, effector binding domain protein n=2 Tax=Pseudoleptotrichia goodfellowii TaxID=157692 RepID=D0GNF6_9FUSO|nr:GyrI-like domain-containing protein [Pseudoleptotrichia goodfellowii]EEY34377.1 transcriptional regulator, effector binding domain protein [Pseudoleptotrichia goodfellowii F0264]MBF4806574.1 effector binding domain-containing protein [Pseudoleptotrichia goodfellowii]BBM35803.1 transcriptional regulator, effector binding domain protein [Pseudoleptotrichia goodfellowii]